jgi:hypothetical protein
MKTPFAVEFLMSVFVPAFSSFSEAHPFATVWERAREQEELLAAEPPGEVELPEEAPFGEAELHVAHSLLDPVEELGVLDD